jgi:hypothetical protein
MWKRRFFQLFLVVATLLIFWKINLQALLLGQRELWDFDIYYRIALDVLAGKSPYSLPYMQTAGPPAVLLFFLPFVVLPLPAARGVMIALSMAAAFGSCYHLARTFFKTEWLTWTLGLHTLFWISFLPRYNLNVGQPNLILMYIIALLVTAKNQKVKTLLLSVLVLIKTLYAASFLSLLKTQKNVLLKISLSLIAVCAVTLPILKPQFYQEYLLHRLSAYLFSTPFVTDVDYYNQSLRSTTARLGLQYSYVMILVFVVLAGGYMVMKSGNLSAGILLSLLISPVVWQHYLVVVYPIAFLLVWKQKNWSWSLAGGVVLLLTHMPWLHGKEVSLLNGIMASHFYFSLVLLFVASLQNNTYDSDISRASIRILPNS